MSTTGMGGGAKSQNVAVVIYGSPKCKGNGMLDQEQDCLHVASAAEGERGPFVCANPTPAFPKFDQIFRTSRETFQTDRPTCHEQAYFCVPYYQSQNPI